MAETHYKPFWSHEAAVTPAPRQLPKGPIAEVLHYVPDDVPFSLSAHQIDVLNEALARRRRQRKHAIDYRGRINWFGKRYYVSLLAGPELRWPTDGTREFCPQRFALKVGSITGLYMLAAALVLPILLLAYLLKSFAGIDLLDGPSLLHELFFK